MSTSKIIVIEQFLFKNMADSWLNSLSARWWGRVAVGGGIMHTNMSTLIFTRSAVGSTRSTSALAIVHYCHITESVHNTLLNVQKWNCSHTNTATTLANLINVLGSLSFFTGIGELQRNWVKIQIMKVTERLTPVRQTDINETGRQT